MVSETSQSELSLIYLSPVLGPAPLEPMVGPSPGFWE